MMFDIIIFIFAVIYTAIIIWLIIGWCKQPYFKPKSYDSRVNFSIIVPVRNEKDNINACLEALFSQDYPNCSYEVLVVDDHSSDGTPQQVINYIEKNNIKNFRLIFLSEYEPCSYGKKSALNAGIKESKHDVIVTTDADCVAGTKWIRTINAYYDLYKPEMLVMPVVIKEGKSLFQKLQALEFCSLNGVTGGSAGWGYPIICNGANQAFTKKAFLKVGGYDGNYHYASGDDVFLLHKMKKYFPGKINYLKNRDVIVDTKPLPGLPEFFNQRRRWLSKNKGCKDWLTVLTGTVAGVFNISLVLLLLSSFLTGYKLWVFAWVWKIIVDFPFLMAITSFFRKNKLLWLYPLASILYPFYVFCTFVFGIKGRYSWKNREYLQ